MSSPFAVVVLAAGEGTRMRSATPKVLHRLAGRSLVQHALVAARGVGPEHVVVVVRAGAADVAAHLVEVDAEVLIATQDDVPGTGRAVECGLAMLPVAPAGGPRTVLVTMADTPLLGADTLRALAEAHARSGAAVTLLSAEVDDPAGYGRLRRDASGAVIEVVEHRDATAEQRLLREVNAGVYAFDADLLADALSRVGSANEQGEKYLTDVIGLLHADGRPLSALPVDDAWSVSGVNDRVQLARLGAELNRRVVEGWMRAGVTVVDPATTWIELDVTIGPDTTIRPHTQLLGACTIGDDVVIGPDTTLTDVEVGAGASIVRTQANLAVIGAGASVGPFAHLRPGTVLGAAGKIGEFVGTKNAVIGDGAKVPHLSYVGDADIGHDTNIGAGTVFANYDGQAKHHTTVGADCRTGSHNTFVAPVTIGDGAVTGAGAVIRADVPPGTLAVSAGPQRHLPDWVGRKRPGTPAARAAERAKGDPAETSEETDA
jgi:bifunctional UDP-N-acetylglucosamine pyrophosphorylase/glucosamine-1-phosphate N-acetyltransferase